MSRYPGAEIAVALLCCTTLDIAHAIQEPAEEAAAQASNEDAPQSARAAPAIHLPVGFEAELLYTVPSDTQGSWVALAKDPKGRIYTSDERGKGLYRVTPAALGDPSAVSVVESVPVDVSGAQGMCWAFNSLYVNVNGQGLWRITDSDGDDQLDNAENLIPLGHGGEHGPHAVLPTEDGEGLYFIAGNHTLPPDFDSSRAPSNWQEDLLLPRLWDARGHAVGKLAPGGWIARCDPNGKNIEIVSNGYRNQYDIALNEENEMFTFDADMEWDIGSPWYRPTRVCHVTSGSEFGWRSGTGKWPTYYEDSLPPVLEIGPGSPTGVVFGTGSKFPERYQRALFVLDWTFGTIYAIHLAPQGATYTGTKEDFAWGKPLAVTDAVVGDDGALYFTVGGRGSQSSLYRIHYNGDESTAPTGPQAADSHAAARAQRRALEELHQGRDPAHVNVAWPALASGDRFVRYAARIAIENQPVESWRERALAETDPRAAAAALLALARQGERDDLPGIAHALEAMLDGDLEESVLLATLRAYAVAFARHGAPSDDVRDRIVARLDPLFPGSSADVNIELARLLTFLGSTTVVPKTLALMRADKPAQLPEWAELIKRNDTYGGPIAKMLADMPPVQDIAYALILHSATDGWTLPLRREYFQFFVDASEHPGGMSYAGFLDNIRTAAAETMTPADRRLLAPLIGQELVVAVPDDVTRPKGPGRVWTVAEAKNVIERPLADGRDESSIDRGENLFHAASCSACHRFNGEGGAIGPDLTTVANRFTAADLLEAMIEPSKVISDQYGAHIVVDREGNIAEGIVVEDGDHVTLYPRDPAEPPLEYERAEVERIVPSKLSQMPDGLIDALNPNELRDLLAFLGY